MSDRSDSKGKMPLTVYDYFKNISLCESKNKLFKFFENGLEKIFLLKKFFPRN